MEKSEPAGREYMKKNVYM